MRVIAHGRWNSFRSPAEGHRGQLETPVITFDQYVSLTRTRDLADLYCTRGQIDYVNESS